MMSPQDAMKQQQEQQQQLREKDQLAQREYQEKQLQQRAQQTGFDAEYAKLIITKLIDLEPEEITKKYTEALEKTKADITKNVTDITARGAAIKEAEDKSNAERIKALEDAKKAHAEYLAKLREQLQKAIELNVEADKIAPIPGFTSSKKSLEEAYKKVSSDSFDPDWKKRQAEFEDMTEQFELTQKLQQLSQKREKDLQAIRYGHGGQYTDLGFWGIDFKSNAVMTVGPNGLFTIQTNMLQTPELQAMRDRVHNNQEKLPEGVTTIERLFNRFRTAPKIESDAKTPKITFLDDGMPVYAETMDTKRKDARIEPDDYDKFIDRWAKELINSNFANKAELAMQCEFAKSNYRRDYEKENKTQPGNMHSQVVAPGGI